MKIKKIFYLFLIIIPLLLLYTYFLKQQNTKLLHSHSIEDVLHQYIVNEYQNNLHLDLVEEAHYSLDTKQSRNQIIVYIYSYIEGWTKDEHPKLYIPMRITLKIKNNEYYVDQMETSLVGSISEGSLKLVMGDLLANKILNNEYDQEYLYNVVQSKLLLHVKDQYTMEQLSNAKKWNDFIQSKLRKPTYYTLNTIKNSLYQGINQLKIALNNGLIHGSIKDTDGYILSQNDAYIQIQQMETYQQEEYNIEYLYIWNNQQYKWMYTKVTNKQGMTMYYSDKDQTIELIAIQQSNESTKYIMSENSYTFQMYKDIPVQYSNGDTILHINTKEIEGTLRFHALVGKSYNYFQSIIEYLTLSKELHEATDTLAWEEVVDEAIGIPYVSTLGIKQVESILGKFNNIVYTKTSSD